MYNRWSTSHIAPQQRAEFWRSASQEALTPITPHIPRLADFEATLTTHSLDVVTLNQVQVLTSSHDVEQTDADLTRIGPPCLLVDMYLSGQAHASQNDRKIAAKPGELFLIDGRKKYKLKHPNPMNMLALVVPYTALGAHESAIKALTMCHLPERVSLRLLSSQLQTLSTWPHELQSDESVQVSDLLVGTLRAVLLGATEDSTSERTRSFLRRKVQQLIARQYADPDLSPAAAAYQMGISVRTLHARLAQDGTSFGTELVAHRLQRAHAMLQAAPRHSTTVVAIAALCGFSSSAHFSRRFRTRYGMPPGALLRDY